MGVPVVAARPLAGGGDSVEVVASPEPRRGEASGMSKAASVAPPGVATMVTDLSASA